MITRRQNIPDALWRLREIGILRDIDLYLVEALVRRLAVEPPAPAHWLGMCLANRVLADGHICLDLAHVSLAWLLALAPGDGVNVTDVPEDIGDWLAALQGGAWRKTPSPLIGEADAACPFVVFRDRCYLRRYWQYEKSVADTLLAMAAESACDGGVSISEDLQLNARQFAAVQHALQSRLTVISGGPGTGKTHSAARILYVLCKDRPGRKPPVIRLAAPTGKAADRLNESVRQALPVLRSMQEMDPACTIERLLGYVPGSPYFRHNKDNPLRADLVLIDEASMVDLPKMAKLLEALPAHCRLILLGDMHQLASVAPGSVMGDICAAGAMAGCVVALTESRRFAVGGSIDTVSQAINGATTPADADAVWTYLQHPPANVEQQHRVIVRSTPDSLRDAKGFVHRDFAIDILRGYKDYMASRTPEAAFAALAQFRVLCALRQGPHGVNMVNRIIEDILAGKGIDTSVLPEDLRHGTGLVLHGTYYSHRPIMITRNDYSLNLFNGDIGVIMPAPGNPGELVACFPGQGSRAAHAANAADLGTDGVGNVRMIACRLLPEHETAFATTVHKAQGSEFHEVLLLLPVRESPVVTKELIYTGITRTIHGVKLWCREAPFKKAVIARVQRSSGLREQLDAAAARA